MRVIAAMSGGVDSAVAAARAVDAGHDVVGVHLALSSERAAGNSKGRGCCTISDANDARRAADVLGIPFYVWDMAAEFRDNVLDDFIAEYAAGNTPNPCLRCNEKIKFAAVLDRAVDLGFDAICTGHYAQIVIGDDGSRELHRSVDNEKDQSYVLGVLTASQLARSMFPLGGSQKSEVRADAAARGLLVADKPDSHDICFIPDGNTAEWLRHKIGDEPGDIVDAVSGEVLGQHDGAFSFTVGQRKGLGLKDAPPEGKPRYVVDVDTSTNVVSIGLPTLLDVNVISGSKLRFSVALPAVGDRCLVQIRAHGEVIPAVVSALSEDAISVTLYEPIRGVAAGQALVLYDGTRVICSATITRSSRG